VAPVRLSIVYWLWRLDLLSLPLFAAGAVALVFGVRMLFRLRFALGFLVLAWPPPYLLLLNDQLQLFTRATAAAPRVPPGLRPRLRHRRAASRHRPGGLRARRAAHDPAPAVAPAAARDRTMAHGGRGAGAGRRRSGPREPAAARPAGAGRHRRRARLRGP